MILPRVIIADPAWRYRDKLPGKRGAAKHYRQTMATRDIAALQFPSDPDACLLLLWRVAPMLEDALWVCKAWGFEYKTELVWVKTKTYESLDPPEEPVDTWMGMGHYGRADHEVCMVCTRGKGASLVQVHDERTSMFAPPPKKSGRPEHSAKPEIFYQKVERMVGTSGPKMELFARAHREGWDCYGDEIGRELSFGLFNEVKNV